MNDESLFLAMNDSRIISASENVIFPLIRLMINEQVNLMTSSFNGGTKDSFISNAAYISALKAIEQRLKRLQSEGNKANLELNKNSI